MTTTKKPLDREGNQRSGALENEPKILSLVKALDATMLVRTLVSYQAHPQTTRARRRQYHHNAVVRFEPCPGVSVKKVWALLNYIFFYGLRIGQPVRIGASHHTFAERQGYFELTIRPRATIVDTPRKLSFLTDYGIEVATKLVGEASKPDAIKQFAKDRAEMEKILARRANRQQLE